MSIEIKRVLESKYYHIETEGERYLRYGKDVWMTEMGDSLEPYYHCEELEAAFQEWCRRDALKQLVSFSAELKGMGG